MPIHLIWGNDCGAIERRIEQFIKTAIDPDWMSINLSRLNGQYPEEAHRSLEEIRTPPFGNGERVVILQKSPFCNGCSNELANHFESIVNLIPENTHLILTNENKPDGRLKTTKLLNQLIKKNQAFEQSFLLPAIWDEIGQKKLVERTAQAMDIELTDDAIFALVEALGNDSQRISRELEKLILLEEAKTKQTRKQIRIGKETVHELINDISTNSLQISNYFLNRNFGEAIKKIDSLLDKGEPALKIIATLTTQVRGWLWISLLEQNGHKEVGFLAKQAGIANPKRIYIIRKQIQGKSSVFFIDLLSKILKIEALLKKGAIPKNAFRDGLLTNGE